MVARINAVVIPAEVESWANCRAFVQLYRIAKEFAPKIAKQCDHRIMDKEDVHLLKRKLLAECEKCAID